MKKSDGRLQRRFGNNNRTELKEKIVSLALSCTSARFWINSRDTISLLRIMEGKEDFSEMSSEDRKESELMRVASRKKARESI